LPFQTESDFGTFFLPGPTEVRPDVLAAMTRPMIGHRGAEFEALFARIEMGLRDVFLTARPVYVSTSSATGFMEAAVRNAPKGSVLSLVNGAFSERFAAIAESCGRPVERINAPLGEVCNLNEVEEALRATPFSAVTVVHSETSTGALSDVRAVTELAHKHGVACLVDSVSGVAGAELYTDRWQLDFVLTGSQKALAIPPGLAFAVASREYVERARAVPERGDYFDVVELDAFASKNQTPSTPAVSLLYALDTQLASIGREGIERRWERHQAMRDLVDGWVDRCSDKIGDSVGVLAPRGARSPTVSAITLPERISGEALTKAVAANGYVIGNGYGSLKKRTVRIGHMGDHTVEGLAHCLDVVEQSLLDLLAAR
jgi:aspartate aminotransferase-like enzyme